MVAKRQKESSRAQSGREAEMRRPGISTRAGAIQLHQDLVPNAGLIEAIEEGRTLKGRSTSTEELFDALENEGQN